MEGKLRQTQHRREAPLMCRFFVKAMRCVLGSPSMNMSAQVLVGMPHRVLQKCRSPRHT